MYKIDDECGYPDYYSDEIKSIVSTKLSDKTKTLSRKQDLKQPTMFSPSMKMFFEMLKSFAEPIIIISFGIGFCVLIAMHARHNQQKMLAEKERAATAKEYESLLHDGVKPWQEIIKRKSKENTQSVLDISVMRKLDYWRLNTPVGNYNHDEYAMRMKYIMSALNFLENDAANCTEAMQKIKALNARCVFMQKIITEYKAAGRPFSKTNVVTENGNIIFKRTVNVNVQTLELEAEDFRKHVAEFAKAWLSDRRSPAGNAIRKDFSIKEA